MIMGTGKKPMSNRRKTGKLGKVLLKEPPAAYGVPEGELVLYNAPDGTVRLDVHLEKESVWLTQKQMSVLFATEQSVITKHLRNIFSSGELERNSVSALFAQTAFRSSGAGRVRESVSRAYPFGQIRLSSGFGICRKAGVRDVYWSSLMVPSL
jgi:hypothetical protein